MAQAGQPVGEPVDEELGAAGRRVSEVTVGEEDDPARMWGERRRVLRRAGGRGAMGVPPLERSRERGRGWYVLGHGCSNSCQGAELSVGRQERTQACCGGSELFLGVGCGQVVLGWGWTVFAWTFSTATHRRDNFGLC
ncbi:hypothetical protein GCM10027074_06200 [Streptomyces deserti]